MLHIAAGVLEGGLDAGSITSDTQDQATSGSEVQRTKEGFLSYCSIIKTLFGWGLLFKDKMKHFSANVVKEGFNKQLISYFVKLAKKNEVSQFVLILHSIPVNLVSKSWYDIISDHDFATKEL